MSSSLLSSILVGAVVLGAVYAAVALGFVVLFRSTGVLSLAQGAFMVFGALIFSTFISGMTPNFYLSLIIAMAITAVIGWLTYSLIYRWAAPVDQIKLSVSTIGLQLVYTEAAYLAWGPAPRTYPPVLGFESLGRTPVTPVDIVTTACCLVGCAAVLLILRRSRLGVEMRATADAPALAEQLGIRVGRMRGTAWTMAAVLAALGGVCYSMSSTLDPSSLPDIGLVVFPAIVLGGIDSVGGAILGGFVLGLLDSIIGTYLGGQWQDPLTYLLLLAVLLVRPTGLFGTAEIGRI
jgi:branched-chain amino acid transport system permease protein